MILETENICRSYGRVKALDHLTFSMRENEIFGMIGPDGAGKTTLFRLITGLLLPDSGRIRLMGYDATREFRKTRNLIGYMPGRFSLYHDLTVEENLNFYATVFRTPVKENHDLIWDIYRHIEPFRKRPAGKLSGGMKQKLALSCALIHRPLFLILDEPTTGVDAVSRKEFWEMLRQLKGRGITILVSTPYMDEAMLCDRVALIQKGRLMAVDSPQGILDGYHRQLYSARSRELYPLLMDIRTYEMTDFAFLFGQFVHFSLREKGNAGEAAAYLREKGYDDLQVRPIKPGIEDCFVDLMGASVQKENS